MRFYLLLWAMPILTQAAPTPQALTQWFEADVTWIRVGLQTPETKLKFHSSEPLLVLEEDRVVQTIRPNGEFWVMENNSSKNSPRWVQFSAGADIAVLEAQKDRLAGLYPGLTFRIQALHDSNLSALRAGPFDNSQAATALRDRAREGDYPDAFIITGAAFPYVWVDQNFDKHPIRASNPVLTRQDPMDPITLGEKAYRGTFAIRPEGRGLRVINRLPLEVYLWGVVPTEMGPVVFPQIEALKAQSIAARTYAIKNMNGFRAKGYDICDSPACQAYGGFDKEHEMTTQAVNDTAGLVLFHDDTLIDALYTSTCGGMTDDVGNVFPGRNDPYLRSVTSYVAAFDSWSLPPRPAPKMSPEDADLAARALIFGWPQPPEMKGMLTPQNLVAMWSHTAWILGNLPKPPERTQLSHRDFWQAVSQTPFFRDAARHQIQEQDLAVLTKHGPLPENLHRFALVLLRLKLGREAWLQSLSRGSAMTYRQALQITIELAEALGPEPEWKTHRVETVADNSIHLSRWIKDHWHNLEQTKYYITQNGGKYQFREAPTVRELDHVLLLQPPHTGHILRLQDNGLVSSVDRYSVYHSWVEKKDLETLEARAKRYVKGLYGLRDIHILERAETGRVTLLELEADSGRHRVDGLRIRWSMGVRDNLFDILPAYRDGQLVHVTFLGRGWGHGIGMSQVGAFGLARHGWNFEQILTHYYTGVTIRPYPRPGS